MGKQEELQVSSGEEAGGKEQITAEQSSKHRGGAQNEDVYSYTPRKAEYRRKSLDEQYF